MTQSKYGRTNLLEMFEYRAFCEVAGDCQTQELRLRSPIPAAVTADLLKRRSGPSRRGRERHRLVRPAEILILATARPGAHHLCPVES